MINAKLIVTTGQRQLNGEMTQNRLLTEFDRAFRKESQFRWRGWDRGWSCDSTPRRKKRRRKR
jgi:hypothetical protein